jgi:hypothetical protein
MMLQERSDIKVKTRTQSNKVSIVYFRRVMKKQKGRNLKREKEDH